MDNAAAPLPTPDGGARGYSRATVDEFVAAMDAERARLAALIGDAEDRELRARSTLSTHEVMLAMLLEAQDELDARKRDAEAEAEAILEVAEREAREMIDLARGRALPAGSVPTPAVAPSVEPEEDDVTEMLDLSATERPESASIPTPIFAMPNGNGHDPAATDSYFDFLRGALADDEPLGPRPQ